MLVGMGVSWGLLRRSVSNIQDTLGEMKPDLKNVRERFAVVEDRVGTIWKDKYAPAASPRQLNKLGESLLEKSGIKEVIDRNRDDLLRSVRERNYSNAYDAEKATLAVVGDLAKQAPPEELDKLKHGAFETGSSLDAILLVGGIYLRNLIFPELGFSLEDIDTHRPADQ